MNLTNEEERLLVWAEKEQKQQITEKIFSKFDTLTESYYEKRVESGNLVYEYGFETFAELKRQLVEMWQMEDFMKEVALISAVAAMKYKPTEENAQKAQTLSNSLEGEFEIPEYVYVF